MNKRYMNAIPKSKPLEKWREIPIKECDELLVEVYNSKKIKLDLEYYRKGISGAINNCYLRKSIVEKLQKASKNLPKGYSFLIWDGYRPVEVQQNIFKVYYNKIKEESPELTEEQVIAETSKFVPTGLNEESDKNPSSHNTGASVDITLLGPYGKPVNMETDVDAITQEAYTRYYEEKLKRGEKLTKEEQQILQNRRLLYNLLAEVGLVNYEEEWWHFGYGCQLTLGEMEAAIYGGAEKRKDLFPKMKVNVNIGDEDNKNK